MRHPLWIAALIVGLSLLTIPILAISAEVPSVEVPDHPRPRPARDRITLYRLWAMRQVTPAYPPYTYEVVSPGQPPLTARACFHTLQQAFTAHKRPTEPEHTQTVMLLQWLSVLPDARPGFAKWIGCWPTGSPYWVAWEMHSDTTGREDARPFWYRVWKSHPTAMSSPKCLDLIRTITGRRRTELINWYDVQPDPPPDFQKRIGCFPSGFDPELRDAVGKPK